MKASMGYTDILQNLATLRRYIYTSKASQPVLGGCVFEPFDASTDEKSKMIPVSYIVFSIFFSRMVEWAEVNHEYHNGVCFIY